jgi:hypothetical protein
MMASRCLFPFVVLIWISAVAPIVAQETVDVKPFLIESETL